MRSEQDGRVHIFILVLVLTRLNSWQLELVVLWAARPRLLVPMQTGAQFLAQQPKSMSGRKCQYFTRGITTAGILCKCSQS